MTHEQARELLARRVELTPHEERLLHTHLGACPECQETARVYAQQRALLRSLPQPEVPPGLRAGVLARVQRPRRQLPLWPALGGIALAAAAVLAFAGLHHPPTSRTALPRSTPAHYGKVHAVPSASIDRAARLATSHQRLRRPTRAVPPTLPSQSVAALPAPTPLPTVPPASVETVPTPARFAAPATRHPAPPARSARRTANPPVYGPVRRVTPIPTIAPPPAPPPAPPVNGALPPATAVPLPTPTSTPTPGVPTAVPVVIVAVPTPTPQIAAKALPAVPPTPTPTPIP